jgi:selenide,water dikinase
LTAVAAAGATRHLLLVGGGHAHLNLLARLATEPVPGWQVTLLSPHSRQIYSGMLPGWLAGHYAIDDCAISLTALAARGRIEFVRSEGVGLDLLRNEVTAADGQRLPFDLLSVDTGSEPALAGIDGAAQHALPVRPIEGFVAAWPGIAARWSAAVTFEMVVVGSGAAAIELAFAIQQRAVREGAARVRVSLVGRDPVPLAGAAPRASRRLSTMLTERGIRWHGSRTAVRIERDAVVFADGAPLPFDACVVSTGAAAPRWPAQAGLATDKAGFIRVDRTLRSVSHPQVFAAGDVAAYADARPKSGVFAVRAGPHLADNLLAACGAGTARKWHPQRRALYLISSGDGQALATWAGWSASGAWVWRWKDRIDRRFVERYRA